MMIVDFLELERTMPEDLFKLTIPPPTEDCYTASGYLKTKCQYDKDLAELYKVSHFGCSCNGM